MYFNVLILRREVSNKRLIFKGTYTKKGGSTHPATAQPENLGESSLQEIFCKQSVFKNPVKLVGTNLSWSLFLIKLQV